MQPPTHWSGGVGYVSKDMVEKHCPPPADDVKVVPSLSCCEAYFIKNNNLFTLVWVFVFGNFSNMSPFLARFRLLLSVTKLTVLCIFLVLPVAVHQSLALTTVSKCGA